MSMPAIERVIPLVGHLPVSIRDALARRLRELAGLSLIALSGVAAAALMTWSVQDPSLSHATSRPIRNVLGYPGAIGADLLMQILGLGAIMLILPVAVWGWRMLTHRTFDREALRLGCWILCTVIAAGFASCWPHGGAWALPTGLGGVVGDALVRAPAVVFGPAGFTYRLVLGIILFAAMCAAFLFASGWGSRPREEELTPIEDDDAPFEEEGDRSSVSLGWAYHALMSAKARLAWLMSAAYRSLVSSSPPPRTASFERQEPSLRGRAAPALAPRDEEFEDEEEEEDEDEEVPAARAPRKKAAPRAAARKSDKFELPSVSVLTAPKASDRQPLSKAELEANSRALEGVLGDFGVRGEIVKANPGPVVTLYELEPAPGIKSSRVIGLADDIARSMSALSARVAVVAGRNAIGIELPNAHRETVYLRELLTAKEGNDSIAKLPLCLGKNIGGESIIVDLARMPHLLIAGTTGSGKSVAINTMILSLVYRLRPDQCRLIMVDLMMVAGKDIEGAVQRLAQMARAAGLHVILATQRPSVDVITGTIKANFPTRISFQVTSKIDSRTILGEMGAEQLLGQGDMLYMAGGGRISRVHGPFVSDEEVEKVVRHLKAQGTPEYLEEVTAEEEGEEDGAVFDSTGMGGDGGGDLFAHAVAIVKRDRKASTSYIQRRLQIGYNRAASLMERMELEGIVGQANHAGKREILVEEEEGRF